PGTILYGIAHSVGHHTLSEINRKSQTFKIPETMLIIGRLNYGDLFCIDLDNQNIIQWDHEMNVEFCRWNSLEEWLEEIIANAMDNGD
nr:SMI1/KNR4 family protein [Lachnospiraceae bacterium]